MAGVGMFTLLWTYCVFLMPSFPSHRGDQGLWKETFTYSDTDYRGRGGGGHPTLPVCPGNGSSISFLHLMLT